MNTFIIIVIVLGAIATATVLVRGIIIMASGKDISGRKSNQMMWYRVMFQGLTVAAIVILMLMMGGGN